MQLYAKILKSFMFQFSYGELLCLFSHKSERSGDRGVIVTYPCQRDGPEGYDSPVPASERPLHQPQAEALQANKSTAARTHTQTHTQSYPPHSNIQINSQMKSLKKLYFLFLVRVF